MNARRRQIAKNRATTGEMRRHVCTVSLGGARGGRSRVLVFLGRLNHNGRTLLSQGSLSRSGLAGRLGHWRDNSFDCTRSDFFR
jgi:hypothetical protein